MRQRKAAVYKRGEEASGETSLAERLPRTPAGGPAIQLHPDTSPHREMASDSTGEGLSPARLPPTHKHVRHVLQVQGVTCASDQLARLAINWGSHDPSLCLINLLEWLTEFRGTFYLPDYWFIMKERNSGTARWKRHLGQGTGNGHRASMPLQASHSPKSPCAHQPGSSPSGFLRRLHYIGTTG